MMNDRGSIIAPMRSAQTRPNGSPKKEQPNAPNVAPALNAATIPPVEDEDGLLKYSNNRG
ncbi:uncharacterized protein N7484_000460 [Penicillium longicatenatum]|uniref:uncharacterized protein n=1 Tax=Penicillium longicatenatum TaxID=1561947 RepID=UPI0025473F3F|nr:uncharacterized protein N7484_000460 [Penicillium longicatenatum]KAJ5661088.1 hypothetical protein N7484_000460 [Penicillium longicatenatum]